MKKLTIILSGAVLLGLLIYMLVFWIRGSGDEQGQNGINVAQDVYVEEIDDGKSTFIEYPLSGVGIEAPSKWTTRYYPTLQEGVWISHKSEPSTYLRAKLLEVSVEEGINAESLLPSDAEYTADQLGGGATRYTGSVRDSEHYHFESSHEGVQDEPVSSRENYLLGLIYERGEKLIYFECTSRGPDYVEFIDDCDSLADSLTIK